MSLFRIAESDYTCAIVRRVRRSLLVGLCLLPYAGPCRVNAQAVNTTPAATTRDAHELYDALRALRVDPTAVYRLEAENRVSLRRGDATLSFDEGKLGFLTALDGRITGAVFSGRGHAVAAPRDPVEKQQMARFLNASVLDEDFTSAYLRFTDSTPDELLDEFRNNKLAPQNDTGFAAHWESMVAQFNSSQNLRLMDSLLSQNSKPYFYAGMDGAVTGAFELFYDLQRQEPFQLGQWRRNSASGVDGAYYDVWVSYVLPGDAGATPAFDALDYAIDTTIETSKELEGATTIEMQVTTAGERLLAFQLARGLNVDHVTEFASATDAGTPVAFFQNEGLSARAASEHGDDSLFVVLPRPIPLNEHFRLRFHYRGNVISDAGNGVLIVEARDSWYPRFGDAAEFAHYDLTMRWPHKMQLVATGTKIDEHVDGEYRAARWRTDHPVAVAGFNLGDYASASVTDTNYSVDVYANRALEDALARRLPPARPAFGQQPGLGKFSSAERGGLSSGGFDNPSPPSPADALRSMGKEIESCIRFYEKFSGPFPFRSLSVSQIPGNFGQGWPGLLYLSTFSYLSPEVQREAGLSVASQEHFTELVPFHEVAHQWWGNVVGWSSYRDQWIDEAMASYLALMFADSRKSQEHPLRVWLERFRKSLLVKPQNHGEEAADTGALTLGFRLNSSKAPQDYDVMIYSKGSWVLHMLREMLRQPGARNPDERFTQLLRTLATKYAYRALSTEDLQKEVEAVMTPAMDLEGGRSMEWFFDEWIRGTGIPRYHVDFSVREADKTFTVRGTLVQDGVPRSFIAPVPLYAVASDGHRFFLGTVTAEGPKTAFHFVAPTGPRKILVDPEFTLLCATD
ncbi:MAG: M1 family aminopeptidase [Candidatus Acidiferrum sp.]